MFFRLEGSGVYVVIEPYAHGYICMGTFENLGTPEHPIYYFDGRYTDHMLEASMVDPVHGKKHTKAEAMRFAKRLTKAWNKDTGPIPESFTIDGVDLYSHENTHWLIQSGSAHRGYSLTPDESPLGSRDSSQSS
jgi:hypothetical protein